MAKRGKRERGEMKESGLAKASVLFLLLNGSLWAGLRVLDLLLISLLSCLLALSGMLLARRALRVIHRSRGMLTGESLVQIGYWGNLIFFIGAFLLFSYLLAMGLIQGNLSLL